MMTRAELLNELEALTELIEEDMVTQDDQRAIAACNFLRYYLVDHLTDDDFSPTI